MPPKLSPTARGRQAEQQAATYLETQGFVILDRNWRNRWCEIDIVARRTGIVHFIEAKYRRTSNWGTGFEHISYDKSLRLTRAALAWVQTHRYAGPYQIDAIDISGSLDQPTLEHIQNVSSSW